MAVYGIGSTYGGQDEMMHDFVTRGLACIGWSFEDAPAYISQLREMTPGDVVFLKSFPVSHGLYIKAVGLVCDAQKVEDKDLGEGRHILWVWAAENKDSYVRLGRMDDKYDQMRGGTIYREFNPEVITTLMGIIRGGTSK